MMLRKLHVIQNCRMFSFGLFPGVCSLNANVSEHTVCSIFIGESVRSVEAVEKFVVREKFGTCYHPI
jgi:hypothetical protein